MRVMSWLACAAIACAAVGCTPSEAPNARAKTSSAATIDVETAIDWPAVRKGQLDQFAHEGRTWRLTSPGYHMLSPSETFVAGDPDLRIVLAYDSSTGELAHRFREQRLVVDGPWNTYGEQVTFYEDGSRHVAHHMHGKPVGVTLVYRADGSIESERLEQMTDAPWMWTDFYPSGAKRMQSWSDADGREKAAITWDEEGNVDEIKGTPPTGLEAR